MGKELLPSSEGMRHMKAQITPPLDNRARTIHNIYRRSLVTMVSPRGAEVVGSNHLPPRLSGNTM